MGPNSTALFERLRELPVTGQWPASLVFPGGEEFLARFAEQLDELPEPVAGLVSGWMCDTRELAWQARALVAGIREARAAGWGVAGLGPGESVLVEKDGDRAALVGLAGPIVHTADDPNIDLLVERLDGCFAGQRYILRIVEPLPEAFDPDPVVAAVHMWLLARGRGEWQGRVAVYDHEGVHIDISLAEAKRSEGSGLVALIRPRPDTESVFRDLSRSIESAVFACEDEDPQLPVIAVVASARAWNPSRWQVMTALYGLPIAAATERSASVPPLRLAVQGGGSLFSDPALRQLAGLWMLRPDASHENARTVRCFESPWVEVPGTWPKLRGPAIRPFGASGRSARWQEPVDLALVEEKE